jgi:hypothetical protein
LQVKLKKKGIFSIEADECTIHFFYYYFLSKNKKKERENVILVFLCSDKADCKGTHECHDVGDIIDHNSSL